VTWPARACARKCHSQGLGCNKQGREEESSRARKLQQDGEADVRAAGETAENVPFLCRMKSPRATSGSKCRCTWVYSSRTTAVKRLFACREHFSENRDPGKLLPYL
jgi:hypothetical protein